MELDSKHQRGLAVGALIGAVLGAGTAFLLLTAPKDEDKIEREPLTGRELVGLTSAAAVFIRRVDNFRRRL
jgi:gas vesicle protein